MKNPLKPNLLPTPSVYEDQTNITYKKKKEKKKTIRRRMKNTQIPIPTYVIKL